MFLSIEEVCDSIINNPLPVAFYDTCSILDVINSLHQDHLATNYSADINKLIQLNTKDIWLVTCQTVYEEWNNNIDNVRNTAIKEIKKTDRNVKAITELANKSLRTNNYPITFSSLNLDSHIHSLSKSLLHSCKIIKREERHENKAFDRIRGNIAPAKKGKSEPKDCEIIECFLELSNILKTNEFNEKIFFITSNTSDFGKSGKLKPPLDSQFSNVNADIIMHPNHLLNLCE